MRAMKCPKCPKTTLDQLPDTGTYAHPPQKCSTCDGVWISLHEVPRVMESAVAETIPGGDAADPAADAKSGMCPEGHGIMTRARVESDGPFSLERCSSCEGVWFDRGEWQRLAGEHLLEHLPDMWEREWRDRQRRTRSRQAHLDSAREDFGDDLYARLTDLATRLRDHPRRSEALAFLREESVSGSR
jgi:Zn-finger nucleic acid-binding protein